MIADLRSGLRSARKRSCVRAPVPLAALVVLVLSGCVDFVGPEEPGKPNLDAQLVLSISMWDGGDPVDCDAGCDSNVVQPTGSMAVSARFFPGTDADGWFRPVMDTLRILDTLLVPDLIDAEGWRRYESVWGIPSPGAGASFDATLPMPLPGGIQEPQPFSIRWAVVGRADPARVIVPPTGDVLLRLTDRPGIPDPVPSFERWQLELSGGGPIFSFGTVGRPPATILVPRAWLPAAPGDTVTAKLVLDQRVTVNSSVGYSIATILRAELHWVLELDPDG